MKTSTMSLMLVLLTLACSKNPEKESGTVSDQFVNGELATVAKERGLKSEDLLSAVKTYNPSGVLDEYIAFFGTGVSGRLAVVGIPSMKILKYVAVFSAEPWQGFAFDDESKAIIKGSAREEIEYSYGDMGTPALSLTRGKHDARALFLADAANGRIGMVDLSEYETKQVVTHPLFKNSNPDLAVSEETKYVAQTTAFPEKVKNKIQSGATVWRFLEKESEGHKHFFLDPNTSFTFLLPDTKLSSPAMGKGISEGLLLTVSQGEKPSLNIINWKEAESQVATKSRLINKHLTFDFEAAINGKLLNRIELPSGSDKVILSGNGKFALITNKKEASLSVIDLKTVLENKAKLVQIDVGGLSIDGAFTDKHLYVSVYNPHQVVKISLKNMNILSTHKLDFPAGKIMIPGSESKESEDKFAVVTNHSPYGKFTRTGPQSGLSAHLLDIKRDDLKSIYNSSVPQSTRLSGVAMKSKLNRPVFKYKIGTDARSGLISDYKTSAGKEMIVRDGKRVHVYATLIRSHITPDFIEVEQGDIVSIHLTSNEQSRDQTHGFTIDTYNVHGSFEPGKTASVTFVADRSGVFPFYCTEFCSALHLEMQGYLLVKPTDKKIADTDELVKISKNPKMKSFFNYIKGE